MVPLAMPIPSCRPDQTRHQLMARGVGSTGTDGNIEYFERHSLARNGLPYRAIVIWFNAIVQPLLMELVYHYLCDVM